MGNEMKKEFYSVLEFAKMLDVHPITIRRAITNGRIEAFRPGIGIKAPYRIAYTELDRIREMSFEETRRNLLKVEKK